MADIVIVLPLGSSNLSLVLISIIITIPQANTTDKINTTINPDQIAIEKYGMQCKIGPKDFLPTPG